MLLSVEWGAYGPKGKSGIGGGKGGKGGRGGKGRKGSRQQGWGWGRGRQLPTGISITQNTMLKFQCTYMSLLYIYIF